jgi:Ca2+-binding EF-hand superfamily protein
MADDDGPAEAEGFVITEEHESELRKAFDEVALPNGMLAMKGLPALMRSMDQCPLESVCAAWEQSDAAIDFDAFLAIIKESLGYTNTDSDGGILAAFDAFDRENSGSISVADFMTFFPAATTEEVEAMVKAFGGQGKVTYPMFCKIMQGQ